MFKFASFLILLISISSFGKTVKVHPLFSVPDGYVAERTPIDSEYDSFKTSSAFYCGTSVCKKNTSLGFTENGYLAIEGKILETKFLKKDGGNIPQLLILRNYKNAIEQLGGKAIAEPKENGYNPFLIEKEGSKTWVIVDLNYPSTFSLIIVEASAVRKIVEAGQLADQINKQGFVNLNVNFDTNKSLIKDGDKPAINEVVTLLKNDPNLKLSVEGHTDNVGNAGANKTLSQARSDSLVAYMVAAGIPAKRLMAKGFGSESPISDNRTDEGKAKNRRVELVKIK
jgi:OmpA-OmpF porin, OOP family